MPKLAPGSSSVRSQLKQACLHVPRPDSTSGLAKRRCTEETHGHRDDKAPQDTTYYGTAFKKTLLKQLKLQSYRHATASKIETAPSPKIEHRDEKVTGAGRCPAVKSGHLYRPWLRTAGRNPALFMLRFGGPPCPADPHVESCRSRVVTPWAVVGSCGETTVYAPMLRGKVPLGYE